MPLVITKPNGHAVTLTEYIRSWRALLCFEPETEVTGWAWYPVSARSILTAIREGIHDRINTRGHLLLQPTRRAKLCGLNLPVSPYSTTLEQERTRRAFRRAQAQANVPMITNSRWKAVGV